MSNIRPVHFKPTINETLVDALEELLAEAKAGRLVSGSFTGTTSDGCIRSTYSSSDNSLLEIAAVSRLLHRLHLRSDDA